MAICRSRSPCPGGAELSQPRLCATGQVSRSWCLTPPFPFLVGRRIEHGLSMGHRVTPKQQERHSLAQIPHSQSHARAASPGLPVPDLQSMGTTRATPFLPPTASRRAGIITPFPCRPASPGGAGQHPHGRGSHPGTTYLLPADVGLPQPGQVSAGLGSPRAHACQHSAPAALTPSWVCPARQVRTGRQRRADCERGGGPGWGQGGPRRPRGSRGERGKGPRGRHASQRKGVCRQATSRQTETPGRAPGRWRQSFVHRRPFERGAVGAPRTKGDFSLHGRGSSNRHIPGRLGWPGGHIGACFEGRSTEVKGLFLPSVLREVLPNEYI